MPRKRPARTGGQGLTRATAAGGFLAAALLPGPAASAEALAASARAVLGFACTLTDAGGTPETGTIPQGFTLSDHATVEVPGRPPRHRFVLAGPDNLSAEAAIDGLGAPQRRVVVTLSRDGIAQMQVRATAAGAGTQGDCAVGEARRIVHDANATPLEIVLLGPDLADGDRRIPLNPPVPAGKDPGGVTVAHIDSGVNYLLPAIGGALARDDAGQILGHDFWDGDERPFDIDLSRSPFFPLHHGTTVASLLLKEAPDIRLVPLRYPRPDMSLMGDAVRRAAKTGARIVAMPMGSREPGDWDSFAEAARTRPDILFVVSAGNDGRDIDTEPLYPASLDLPNMLVVTSADDFGRIAPGSNWGAQGVDLMVPAERIEVTDHRGASVSASGSSYAVPRVAALAARLLEQNPEWTTPELIAAIAGYAAPGMDRGGARVKLGWIPDPAGLP